MSWHTFVPDRFDFRHFRCKAVSRPRTPRLVLAAVLLLVLQNPERSSAAVITEYMIPTAPSGSADITAGPDGAVWFTERAVNQIGRITPSGAITEYPLPPELVDPTVITAGPDGALWFGARGALGRITTGGVITAFPFDPGGPSPTGIVTRPDGALWFIGRFGGDRAIIGRMTTSGQFTMPYSVFDYTTTGPQPLRIPVAYSGITVGANGDLWVGFGGTQADPNNLRRITMAGAVTGYTVQVAGPLDSLTFGPNGAVWFADLIANQIVQMITTGSTSRYTIPTSPKSDFGTSSYPSDMTVGPDGALWFTEERGNKIGRITTAGTITEYPAPSINSSELCGPRAITTGPDGALWFIGRCGNTIGRLLPTPFDVSVGVNQDNFDFRTRHGNTLRGSVFLTSPGSMGTADFYMGFVLADAKTIAFFTEGGGFALGSVNDLATFQPVAANFSLAAPFSIAAPNFFTRQLNFCEPAGTYTFFLLAVKAGALLDGSLTDDEILGLSTTSFVLPDYTGALGGLVCNQ